MGGVRPSVPVPGWDPPMHCFPGSLSLALRHCPHVVLPGKIFGSGFPWAPVLRVTSNPGTRSHCPLSSERPELQVVELSSSLLVSTLLVF